jgi:SAM-dependent methyltransferase
MPGAETFNAPADAYDRLMGRYAAPLATELIAFAGIEPPMRALDVGCGPGALTDALARRLGRPGVSAADPSQSFVDACRTRLPGIDVALAPAESLPFADATFDVVCSQLVVNFMRDPEAGVREMARVARPGATVTSCVWDYSGGMTLLCAFWDAACEVQPQRATPADERVVMAWCAEGELATLWRQAGLRDVRDGSLAVCIPYSGFDDAWAPFLGGVGPSGAFCASLDDDARSALRDAFRRRLGVGDEPFELTARAWAVAGTRSSEAA